MAGSKAEKPTQNIFQIMDEIVRQLNRTKKMFLIMIVSIIIVIPGTFITTFALVGGPFWNWNGQQHTGVTPDVSAFRIAGGIVVAFVLGWIIVGIRQWFILSKWTQRYELYKELQKKIDEKLDYDDDNNEKQV